MNSSRCFRTVLIVLLAVALTAGVVGSVTVNSESTPAEAQVGATVEATYQLTELYQNPSFEQWTLRLETQLENATWTIQTVNQAGNVIEQTSADGQNASRQISLETGTAEVRVLVRGTVPEIRNYTYPENETFLFTRMELAREGGTTQEIATYETHHYTNESQTARQEIRAAERAIEAAGGNEEARRILDNAVSAYENGNFDNAIDLANQAEERVQQAQQSQQTFQLILTVVGAVVVIAAIVGGVYWYRSQQRSSRL